MAGVLQPILDLTPRALQNLLRLGLRRGDQLAFLTLAINLRALADRAHFFLELRQALLNVGSHLIRFRAAFPRLFRLALDLLASRCERTLHRATDRPSEKREEGDHVRQFPDPRWQTQKLRTLMWSAHVFPRMRRFGARFFR